MFENLDELEKTHQQLTERLADPELLGDRNAYTETTKALAEISPTVTLYRDYRGVGQELADTEEMLGGLAKDDELYDMVQEERQSLLERRTELDEAIKRALVPKDPNDARNAVLEIRAGTGGGEATLFAAELFRMYSRYAENRGWRVEVIDLSESAVGGFKEVSAIIEGKRAFGSLRYEGGVHRVQRVPQTESSGRIHTSAVTVAVLPEAEDIEVEIDEKDLRIDRYCSSGPGGQGVNTTYSAVRLTHEPTGIVVTCQDERSQIKNKTKALRVLKARLLEIEREKAASEISEERRKMVGSGDRSEKIRTYNFPQSRVTDHRIGVTVHQLQSFLEGDLEPMLQPLAEHFAAELLGEQVAAVSAS